MASIESEEGLALRVRLRCRRPRRTDLFWPSGSYLDGTDDTALLLRRFDRIERAQARDHRDLDLLSKAFGRYMRLWFLTHAPNTAEAGKAAGRAGAETQYRHFAWHLGEHFKQGHRFIDDLPVEALGEDEGT